MTTEHRRETSMSNTRKLRPPAAGNGTTAAGHAAGTAADEAPEQRTITFMGEEFRLADKIPTMPMLMFQRYADSGDPRGMTALYLVLEGSIHEDDWQRFLDAAISGKADDEELINVVVKASEAMAAYVSRREQRRRAAPQDRKPPQRRQPARRK